MEDRKGHVVIRLPCALGQGGILHRRRGRFTGGVKQIMDSGQTMDLFCLPLIVHHSTACRRVYKNSLIYKSC